MAKTKTKTEAEVVDLDAPGLDWRKRRGGKRIPYWIAARKAVKAGYRPKTVRLAEDAGLGAIAATCRRLQNEMLAWLGSTDRGQPPTTRCDGTVAGLIRLYETSSASPINRPYDPDSDTSTGVKFNTRDHYLQSNRALYMTVGERLLRNVTADDIWGWYDRFCEPKYEGGKPQVARGKHVMGQFVRLVKFGVAAEVDGCARLAGILTGAGLGSPFRFPNPARRDQQLTHAQVIALCDTVRTRQWKGRRCDSMALATVLQFETGARQADIIGQWVPVSKSENGVLVRDGRRWVGLTWGIHLDPDTFVFAKPTSKSRGKKTAHADLRLSPMAMAMLMAIPREQRIGPVVINEVTGLPYERTVFNQKWRRIARETGIPDAVQNRDARAGALTEMDDAGIEPGRSSRAATHGKIDMTRSYQRESAQNANYVLGKRVAARKQD